MAKKQRYKEPVYESFLSVRPNYSTFYRVRVDGGARRRAGGYFVGAESVLIDSEGNDSAGDKQRYNKTGRVVECNDTRGVISEKAKGRINAAIEWIVYSAKNKTVIQKGKKSPFRFRVNFITLTLPAMQGRWMELENGRKWVALVSDEKIKQALKMFLDNCRIQFGLKNYVWRAEVQKNGNLHFHLLTDAFIHWKDIRKYWNLALNSIGFIDRFARVHGHRNPNSTDVHSVRKVKKLGAYLSKYMAKGSDVKGRFINGRLWFLSKSVQGLTGCRISLSAESLDFCEQITRAVDRFPAQCWRSFDYARVLLVDVKELIKAGAVCVRDKLKEFLKPLEFEAESVYIV